jgi:DNA-directed RNA polymerase alpha subunit
VDLIRDEKDIPVKGAYEIRFLAKTYNLMHQTNMEKKEKLTYEATHDKLTGLYNRRELFWHLDTMEKAIEEGKERSRLELENAILRSKLKNFMPEKDFMNPPEEPEPPKDLLIDDLELSVRSFNCLCRAGLRDVKDLSKISKEQLMKVRNLGRKSYEEVLEKLREVGIELAED